MCGLSVFGYRKIICTKLGVIVIGNSDNYTNTTFAKIKFAQAA